MYWTGRGTIQRAALDGSNIEDLITRIGLPRRHSLEPLSGVENGVGGTGTGNMPGRLELAGVRNHSLDRSAGRQLYEIASRDELLDQSVIGVRVAGGKVGGFDRGRVGRRGGCRRRVSASAGRH